MQKRKRGTVDKADLPAPKRVELTRGNLKALSASGRSPSESSQEAINVWVGSVASVTSETHPTIGMPSSRKGTGKGKVKTSKTTPADEKPSNCSSYSSSGRGVTSRSKSSKSNASRSEGGITPCSGTFEQNLADNNIHPVHASSRPANDQFLREWLERPRASLSPLTETAFENFVKADELCHTEDQVRSDIMPILLGQFGQQRYPASANLSFNNLLPMTNPALTPAVAPAKPDYYDGALPSDIDLRVRTAIAPEIQPSTKSNAPLVPNYACEIKGADGSPAVAQRQACHDGAIGARAIHRLQSYPGPASVFDGSAYSFTNTYQKGSAMVYAHHPTAPSVPGGQPHYHMTRLAGTNPVASREDLKKTCRLFRNTRDLSAHYRSEAIAAANARQAAIARLKPTKDSDQWVNVTIKDGQPITLEGKRATPSQPNVSGASKPERRRSRRLSGRNLSDRRINDDAEADSGEDDGSDDKKSDDDESAGDESDDDES